MLLPEAVDDYVCADNPVRFIDAFVDKLNLAAAGFVRASAKATGRPGYAPSDLLKLYIYGYLNRGRSSRRLEAETHRNIEVIWLLRHLKPDFKTIADFRRDNHKAFRKLADARLDDYLQRLDKSDATEAATGGSRVKNLTEKIAAFREGRTRCQEMLAELDRSGESQISLTDPDSRAMAAHTHVAVGYDEPGGVSDPRSGEGPCGVQPDRIRLQSQAGAEYRRFYRVNGRSGDLMARRGAIRDRQPTQRLQTMARRQFSAECSRGAKKLNSLDSAGKIAPCCDGGMFPHGLLDFCIHGPDGFRPCSSPSLSF